MDDGNVADPSVTLGMDMEEIDGVTEIRLGPPSVEANDPTDGEARLVLGSVKAPVMTGRAPDTEYVGMPVGREVVKTVLTVTNRLPNRTSVTTPLYGIAVEPGAEKKVHEPLA